MPSVSASVGPSVSDAGPDADDDDDDADFCWSDEETLIRTQPATAVYINPYDEVVIRQQDYHGPCADDDKIILIDRKYLPRLIRRLQEIAAGGW